MGLACNTCLVSNTIFCLGREDLGNRLEEKNQHLCFVPNKFYMLVRHSSRDVRQVVIYDWKPDK